MEKLINVSKTALSLLKEGGADNASCRARFSTVREFNVDNGRFSLYRTLYGNSITLTALVGGKKGVVSAASLEEGEVKSLCADCIAAANAGKADEAYTIAAENKQAEFVSGATECDESKLFERSRELLEDIKERYPLIVIEQMIITHSKSETVYADASGTVYKRISGAYSAELMYSAHEGDKTSSFFGSGVVCDNLDTPFIELGRIANELEEVQKQIETEPVNGKFTGTIILPPAALGGIIDSAVGNFASGGALLEGTSPWAEMLGKQVADSKLTVHIAPGDKRIISGTVISGEGFINEDFTFIKNGVLEGFVMSHYFAKKLGKAASPNTTDNYIVENGDTALEDMIKGVKKGLWIGRLSGGHPASNGDFSAVAKNSFLIENGEIKQAVSETMVNGNLKDMLMSISAISKETVADGQTVLPFVAVENLVISGK